jgi:hypothetical protein
MAAHTALEAPPRNLATQKKRAIENRLGLVRFDEEVTLATQIDTRGNFLKREDVPIGQKNPATNKSAWMAQVK